MITKLRGTGIAIVTPFTENREVDYPALKKLVNYLIDGGVEHLVVMGTTGENAVLNASEKKQVLDTVIAENQGRLPIVLGIGGNNTQAVVEQIKDTDFTGVDAILSVSPAYSKPTQEGIYRHFEAVATASPLPIILYNVPGRTSSNMSASTTLRLANNFDNVIAIKEASGDMMQCMEILRDRPNGFLVLSGDDALTLPIVLMGGDGVISVQGMAYPKEFSAMVREGIAGNNEKARDLHYMQLEMMNLIFAEGNPGGIKEVLKQRGVCDNYVRLPLVEVSPELSAKIKAELK
mgnify:FL=1